MSWEVFYFKRKMDEVGPSILKTFLIMGTMKNSRFNFNYLGQKKIKSLLIIKYTIKIGFTKKNMLFILY